MGSNMRPRYIQFRDIRDRDISGLHCISRHKLSQNDNFESKYPSSVAAILKLRFRDHVTPMF